MESSQVSTKSSDCCTVLLLVRHIRVYLMLSYRCTLSCCQYFSTTQSYSEILVSTLPSVHMWMFLSGRQGRKWHWNENVGAWGISMKIFLSFYWDITYISKINSFDKCIHPRNLHTYHHIEEFYHPRKFSHAVAQSVCSQKQPLLWFLSPRLVSSTLEFHVSGIIHVYSCIQLPSLSIRCWNPSTLGV